MIKMFFRNRALARFFYDKNKPINIIHKVLFLTLGQPSETKPTRGAFGVIVCDIAQSKIETGGFYTWATGNYTVICWRRKQKRLRWMTKLNGRSMQRPLLLASSSLGPGSIGRFAGDL
jgi:hypothetical protein